MYWEKPFFIFTVRKITSTGQIWDELHALQASALTEFPENRFPVRKDKYLEDTSSSIKGNWVFFTHDLKPFMFHDDDSSEMSILKIQQPSFGPMSIMRLSKTRDPEFDCKDE